MAEIASMLDELDKKPAVPEDKPIDILSTPQSQAVANIHPAFLVAIIAITFRRLVADPVSTLVALVPVIAILQAAYCILCLPSSAQAPSAPKPGQKKSKGQKPPSAVWTKLVQTILSLTLTVTLTTPLLYIVVILFGAPFTTHHAHTFLLALHLALLTTPHLFYIHSLDAARWMKIVSLQLPIDETYGLSLGACVGAWLGAIPIPLDWDRDWQKWPVTVVGGLWIGAAVGKVGAGYLCKGWRIKMT